MIYIKIADTLSNFIIPKEDVNLFERAALTTLQYVGIQPDAELTIVLTDDGQLHQLNQKFLGIDASTDVLSFPSGEIDPGSGAHYLGDVLISYPHASAQASTRGHSALDELQLLIVHGVLHLLAYDHTSDAEKAEMWSIQDNILSQLGCAISSPTQ